jgi:hypothetical protein
MSSVKRKPSKLWIVSWGPDSRHLHESAVHYSFLTARCHYEHDLGKAKQLVRIEYPHRMSEGENRTILKEQIA